MNRKFKVLFLLVISFCFIFVGCNEQKNENYKVTFNVNNLEYGHLDGETSFSVNKSSSIIVNGNSIVIDGQTISAIASLGNDGYTYEFSGWENIDAIRNGNDITITANFSKKLRDYSITYILNHGKNSNQNPQSYNIESLPLTLNVPSRHGYNFEGWYSNSSFSGDALNSIPEGSIGNKIFYAKWSTEQYTITYHNLFDAENDAQNPISYNIASGEIELKDAHSRENYIFGGWYTNEDFSGAPITVIEEESAGNLDLYAKWVGKTYLVSFDTVNETVNVQYGENYPLLPTPTKTGYNFVGWYTESDGGILIDQNRTVEISENITLFAHWDNAKYIITLDANGGEIEESTLEVTFDEPYGTLPEPTRDYYYFIGWYLANGSKVLEDSLVTKAGSETFYAHWKGYEFNVTFFPGDGRLVGADTKTVEYGSTYGELPRAILYGYTFDYWYQENSNAEIYSSYKVEITKDTNFYAKYHVNTYNLTLNDNYDNKQVRVFKYTGIATVGDYGWSHDLNGHQYNNLNNTSIAYIGGFESFLTDGDMYAITINFKSVGFIQTMDVKFTCCDKSEGYARATVNSNSGGSAVLKFRYDASKLDVNNDERMIVFSNFNSRVQDFVIDNITISKLIDYNSSYGTLPSPTRSGYEFTGWYTTSDGGIKVDENTILSIAENSTIYAHWLGVPYEVNFDVNCDDYIGELPNSKTVTYDSTYGELPTLEITGYDFIGWFTEAVVGSQITENTIVKINSNTTLYAHWSAKKYTITFDPNGGTVAPESINVVYDGTYSELPTPSRTGYTFNGWFTASDGGDEIVSTTKVQITSAQTLYAHWTASKYEVTFNSNGGSEAQTSKDVTFNEEYGELPTPSRTGNTFNGWFTAINGGDEIVSTTKVQITSAQTLYAHWTANKYEVTFDPNGGSEVQASQEVTYDEAYGELPTTTKDGYTLIGWFTEVENGTQVQSWTIVKITQDQTLYAHWQATEYTITYNLYSGTNSNLNPAMYSIEDEDITLFEPTKTGYTFDGWYADEEFNAKVTTIEKGTTGNKTFYAKWIAISYTISYELNGGNLGEHAPLSVNYDEGLIIDFPTKVGYAFDGWRVTGMDTSTHLFGPNYSHTSSASVFVSAKTILFKNLRATSGNVTFEAKWIANTYTLTLDANGGSVTPISKEITYDEVYGELPTPSRTGYTFNGWFTASDGGDEIVSSTKVQIISAQTLYAHWTANKYAVSFDANSGSVATTSKQVTYDELYGDLPIPTKDDYNFVGWYTESTGGKEITSNSKVETTSAQTLYAHWSAISYSISYNLNGGTNGSNPASYTIESSTITLKNATKDGYAFDGWYENSDLSGTKITTISKGSTGNKSLYAKWIANKMEIRYHSNGGTFNITNAGDGWDTLPQSGDYKYERRLYSSVAKNLWAPSYARATKLGYIQTTKFYNTKADGSGLDINVGPWNADSSTTAMQIAQSAGRLNDFKKGDIVLDLYIVWYEVYTITLNVLDDNNTISYLYIKNGQGFYETSNFTGNAITSITPPLKNLSAFDGYYTQTNGSGTKVIDSDGTILVDSNFFKSNDNLYANWTTPSGLYSNDGTYTSWDTLKQNQNIIVSDNRIYKSGKNLSIEGTLVIDSEVESIEERAFVGYENLTSIVIPSTVKTFGNGSGAVINSCTNLKSIIFEENDNLSTISGYSSQSSIIYNCPNLEIVDLSKCYALTTIGSYTFYNLTSDKDLQILLPQGLKQISSYTFAKSTIKEIVIPNTVEAIDKNAFDRCTNLDTLQFEQNSVLNSIGNNAFYNCSITEIILPDSITKIGDYAFQNNSSVSKIVIGTNLSTIGSQPFVGTIDANNDLTLYCYADLTQSKLCNMFNGTSYYNLPSKIYIYGSRYSSNTYYGVQGVKELYFKQDIAPTSETILYDGNYGINTFSRSRNSQVVENGETYVKYVRNYYIRYRYTYQSGNYSGLTPNYYTTEAGLSTLPTPTREGYDFVGWFTASTDGEKISSIPVNSTGDITLYDRWELANYTISYQFKYIYNGQETTTAPYEITFDYLPTSYTMNDTINLDNITSSDCYSVDVYRYSDYTVLLHSIPRYSTGDKTLYVYCNVIPK